VVTTCDGGGSSGQFRRRYRLPTLSDSRD